ncbi:uncharacterized protein PV09_07791 [Verruconis gallopava]|uniref:PIG-P domain-containing protein n=1 Tax=Verruconis gallopava TaxID=253628 RepID=A0A0D1YIW0_9PEZI|nr:uncharacterized protein PV09_07791 [Verruconis gallopava]KIW00812.1 hypothetical protein PV09_07791 [Verruconis gallopava]
MPPQSRGGQRPSGIQQSQSSPNLPTVRELVQHERDRLPFEHHERNRKAGLAMQSTYIRPNSNGAPQSSDDDVTTEDDDDRLVDQRQQQEERKDRKEVERAEQDDQEQEEEDDDEEEEEEEEFPSFDDDENETFHLNRSHAHLPPSSSQLFPPFYNRPPTPLPPSPSLTSLLRPSFSTHTSHHTTPESSDTESATGASATFPGSTHAAASKSASAPRAHPKVPTYEYYGFALYLASSLFFLMYLLWAYLPSPFLHQLGIYYYPNRWWALAIPCWLVVLVIWIYIALQSYNTGTLTLRMASIECIVDEAGKVAVLNSNGEIVRDGKRSRFQVKRKGRGTDTRKCGGRSRQSSLKEEKRVYVPADLGPGVNWKNLWNEGTDAVLDVPIGGVCEILYAHGESSDGEDIRNPLA